MSRIEKNKGYDTFLKAIKELVDQEKIKNEKFLVVGGGAEEDKFNELVKKLNLKDYLEIRNMVSQEELINIYNSLDIFVFPTRRKSESLGLVGLEAMACETIVISSDAKGPMSYVKNKKNAYVFKQGDSKSLVDVINTVTGLDTNDIDKIKAGALSTAEEYDSTNMDDILYKVFR